MSLDGERRRDGQDIEEEGEAQSVECRVLHHHVCVDHDDLVTAEGAEGRGERVRVVLDLKEDGEDV